MITKNFTANLAGQLWAALMSIAFVPTYIEYLGIEAYGLIGFFAALSVWLGLLDGGLSQAASREIAIASGADGNNRKINSLIRTVEIIIGFISVIVIIAFVSLSGALVHSWLDIKGIPNSSVRLSLCIVGAILALRLVEGIYRNCLLALEHHVVLNLVTAIVSTLRGAGAASVLVFVSASVELFFAWQLVVSILSLITLRTIAHRYLPQDPKGASFSIYEVKRVWRYAGGMTLLTLSSILFSQLDKIYLLNLMPLSQYGYYSLAATVAGALYMLNIAISQAYFPQFCRQSERGAEVQLLDAYKSALQMNCALHGAVSITVALHAEAIVYLWTGDKLLAQQVGPPLMLLSIGSLFAGIYALAQKLQLAHGWTSLTVCLNFTILIGMVIASTQIVPSYLTVGAAAIWVVANLVFLLVYTFLMHIRILRDLQYKWLTKIALPPIIACLSVQIPGSMIISTQERSLVALAEIALLGLLSLMLAIGVSKHFPMRQKILIKLMTIAKKSVSR